MILTILWQILSILLFIFIAHSLWKYFQSEILIKPKISNITPEQIEKYESIMKELQSQKKPEVNPEHELTEYLVKILQE
jgi:hypothetical protein